MLPGGALLWESLNAIADKVQSVGWHIQLQLDGIRHGLMRHVAER